MITLYTGVPGSGKSYKMVHDLAAFVEKQPEVPIVSNIRNLKLGHEDFDNLLNELFPGEKLSQQIERFFDYDHQKELSNKFGGPIMYVLDECQLYFPRRAGLPKTESYLQRHRHLGHYLFLATQSARLINSNFIPLIETEIHAARRTISFMGEIHYKEKSPQSRQITNSFSIRPKKKIFELYQSFEAAEINRPKPVLLKYFIIPLLFSPLLYVFYDKYLRVPVKEEKRIERSVPDQSAPKSADPKLKQELELLQLEIVKLQEQINNTERVFLPVVAAGDRKITIDPDTRAVVDLGKIKHRVTCVNGGLTCYFDRPVNSGVKIAAGESSSVYPGQATSYIPYQSMPYQDAIPRPQTGTGFSTPFPVDLIPSPEKIKSGPITIGRQPE